MDIRSEIKSHMSDLIELVGMGFHPDDPVVAGAGIDAETAISANIFIDYAFEVLGDGVYDLCIEILKEKGLWQI